MNPTRFDTLTKSLATSISRRRTLKGLVVTAAGGLFGLGTLWKLSTVLASNSPLEDICRDQDVHVSGKQQKLLDHSLKMIRQNPESTVFCGPDGVNTANGPNGSSSSTSTGASSTGITNISLQTSCPSGQTICNGICCPSERCVNGSCCPSGQTICNGTCCTPGQGCSRFTGACCNPSGSVCDLSNPGACCSGICINGSPPRCA
jgi:hypothetical protein